MLETLRFTASVFLILQEKMRLKIGMRLLSNEISRKWQVASLSEYNVIYLLNKFSWFKVLWKSIHMTLHESCDFLITRISDVLSSLLCFFCTFIRSLRSPRLNLRHVSNNRTCCEMAWKRKEMRTHKTTLFAQKWNFAGFPAPFGRRRESTRSYIRSQLYPACRDFTPRRFVSCIPFRRLLLRPDDTDKSVSRGFFVRSCRPKHCFVEHSICRNVRDSSQELFRLQ